MTRRTRIILIVILPILIGLPCYIGLCGILWAATNVNYEGGLLHVGFLSKEHSKSWGSSIYDVNVSPNKLTVNSESVEISDAWVEVCKFRKFYPILPFCIIVEWDWKVVHLCLDVQGHQIRIKELPQRRQMRHGCQELQWGFLSPKDPMKLNGYLVSNHKGGIDPNTDFTIHIPWDEIRKDWDLDSYIWYPDCNDCNDSDPGEKTIRFNMGIKPTR